MNRREMIAEKIAARSHYEDRGYETPCRIWDGPTSGAPDKTRGHGYGRMNLDGATVAVHIAAWVNENGLIPPKKQLDHLCHQRDCCEEKHLKLRTHKQNQKNKRGKLPVVSVSPALGAPYTGPWPTPAEDPYAEVAQTIINHGIPADRLPAPAAEVTDE